MEWSFLANALLVIFVMMLISGFPVAIAMIGTSMLFIILFLPSSAMAQLPMIILRTGTNFSLLTIPLFILMAGIIKKTGLTNDLFDMMKKWFGHLPGGLGIASVAACAAFGAVTGSSIATTVTLGSIAIPEMRKAGYDGTFATAIIASAGPLGTLIPPSNTGILYGVITETSIGKIFIANLFPGLLLSFLFMVYIAVTVRLKPSLAPPSPKWSWAEKVNSLKKVLGIVILMIIVMGSIYGGICTPSEAAALGCSGAFIIAIFLKKLSLTVMREIFYEVIKSTSTVMLLLIGTYLLGYVIIYSDIASNLTAYALGLSDNKWIIIGGVYALFIFLGMLMDPMAIVCLAIPLIFPILVKVGFDPIWIGVMVVVTSMIGFVSPPVGLTTYIAHSFSEDLSLGKLMVAVIPFMLVMIVFLFIITVFPSIALWLPSHM